MSTHRIWSAGLKILALVVLTLLVVMATQRFDAPKPVDTTEPVARPKLILSQFIAREFHPDGKLSRVIQGQDLRQFPDDPAIQVQNPILHTVTATDIWRLQSQQAQLYRFDPVLPDRVSPDRVSQDQSQSGQRALDQVIFMNQVEAQQFALDKLATDQLLINLPSDSAELTLTTQQLTLDNTTQQLTTPGTVKLQSAHGQTDGQRLTVKLDNNVLTLQQIESVLQPVQQPQ